MSEAARQLGLAADLLLSHVKAGEIPGGTYEYKGQVHYGVTPSAVEALAARMA